MHRLTRRVFASSIFVLSSLWIGLPAVEKTVRYPLPTDRLRFLLGKSAIDEDQNRPRTPFFGENQFVVYVFHKSLTLIALTKWDNKIGLEEICISKAAFDFMKITWQQWRDMGYPKALSHFRIDWPTDLDQIETKATVRALIPSDRLPLSHALLQILWQIDATPLNSLSKSTSQFSVSKNGGDKIRRFTSKWPDDLSPLANKPLILHFNLTSDQGNPDYWPSLIRIGSGLQRHNLIAIASGRFRALNSFGSDESDHQLSPHLQSPLHK